MKGLLVETRGPELPPYGYCVPQEKKSRIVAWIKDVVIAMAESGGPRDPNV